MHYKIKNYEYFSKDANDLNKIDGVQASSGPSNIGGVGPEGPKGFLGPPGPSGPPLGQEGYMGPPGQRGNQGIQGLEGRSGKPPIIQGIRGVIGPQGNVGPDGDIGIKGPTGRTGIIGLTGQRGPPGTKPEKSTVIAPSGPNGSIGPQGIEGIKGEEGPFGDVGLLGSIGNVGMNGLEGNFGKNGDGIAALFGHGTPQETKKIRNIFIPNINYAANGNIGINTENPERKLHIKNSSNNDKPPLLLSTQYGYVEMSANNTNYAHIQTDRSKFLFNKDIDVDSVISTPNNTDLILKTNNNDRIIINNGNVGIGKVPSDILDINGSLKGTSICIGNQCMNEEKLKLMFNHISKPKEQKINSMSFTIDHKDQGWGNRCSNYGLFYYDGANKHGAKFSANRGEYIASSHTVEFVSKPIYKPGIGKVLLIAGGHWPGCAIYVKNIRDIKLHLSDGNIINVASISGSYYTGKGKSKNHQELASSAI